jgi:hypothetical protein
MHGLVVVGHALGVACRRGAWCLGMQVGHRPIVSVLAQLAGLVCVRTAGSFYDIAGIAADGNLRLCAGPGPLAFPPHGGKATDCSRELRAVLGAEEAA